MSDEANCYLPSDTLEILVLSVLEMLNNLMTAQYSVNK